METRAGRGTGPPVRPRREPLHEDRLHVSVGPAPVKARDAGDDAFAAIEQVIPWQDFGASLDEAEQLARPDSFDHLSMVIDQYRTLRNYSPHFLSVLTFNALEARALEEAKPLIDHVARLMPRVKTTDVLTDVDAWTDFTRHFVHVKTDEPAADRTRLLSTLLADGINLGLVKMADSSPGATYAQLSRLKAFHVRDETYAAGLADLVNAQYANPFARH